MKPLTVISHLEITNVPNVSPGHHIGLILHLTCTPTQPNTSTHIHFIIDGHYPNHHKHIPTITQTHLITEPVTKTFVIDYFSCGGGGCGLAVYSNMKGLEKMIVDYTVTTDDEIIVEDRCSLS